MQFIGKAVIWKSSVFCIVSEWSKPSNGKTFYSFWKLVCLQDWINNCCSTEEGQSIQEFNVNKCERESLSLLSNVSFCNIPFVDKCMWHMWQVTYQTNWYRFSYCQNHWEKNAVSFQLLLQKNRFNSLVEGIRLEAWLWSLSFWMPISPSFVTCPCWLSLQLVFSRIFPAYFS